MRTLSLLLSLSVVCVCCSPVNEAQRILNVDVETLLSDEDISIYDLFSKVEVIALDDIYPLSNTVYSGDSYIAFDGDNIYILDERTFKINVYYANGSIRHQVDKVGRGAGEFTMAYQIGYDANRDLIEILNPIGKILRYSADSLEFVSELNFVGNPRSTHNFCAISGDYVLYSSREEDKLYAVSGDDGEIASFGYTPPEFLRKYMTPQSPFLYLGTLPCVFRSYDGLIYNLDVTDMTMYPIIVWDFGKYQCKLRDIPRYKNARDYRDFIMEYSRGHIASFINIKNTDDKIFANVIFDGDTYTLYYDLVGDKALFFKETKEGIRFLLELFWGNVMYKYVDKDFLPYYVNRDMLDAQSQSKFDEVMQKGGAAVIKYTLR